MVAQQTLHRFRSFTQARLARTRTRWRRHLTERFSIPVESNLARLNHNYRRILRVRSVGTRVPILGCERFRPPLDNHSHGSRTSGSTLEVDATDVFSRDGSVGLGIKIRHSARVGIIGCRNEPVERIRSEIMQAKTGKHQTVRIIALHTG